MTSTTLFLIARLTLGLVCLWSGIDKVLSIRAFHESVARYRLLPTHAVAPVGTVIVVVELVSGLLLLTDSASWLGAFGSMALFGAFTFALIANLIRGNRVACHCFGYSEAERVSAVSAARAILLLIASAVTFSSSLSKVRPQPLGIILPSLVLAATFAMTLRLVTLVPQAWSYLAATPIIMPTRGHRVSFKHIPLDRTLAVLRPSRQDGRRPT